MVEASSSPSLRPQVPAVETWPFATETPTWKLKVSIHHHVMARRWQSNAVVEILNCWTYISSGLNPSTGWELIMSVKRRDGQDVGEFPLDILRIYDKIYGDAVNGHVRLARWELIELQEPLFGRLDSRTLVLGFCNIPVFGLEKLQLDKSQASHFHAIAITDEEVAVARTYGLTGALMVGDGSSGWFPFAPYIDRDRKSGTSLVSMKESVLGKCPTLDIRGLNAFRVDKNFYLHIPVEKVDVFKMVMQQNIGPNITSLKIDSKMHGSCDSAYVWQPEHRITIITSAGHEKPRFTALNFLLFCPNQPIDIIKVEEDGCLGS
jgi:hypothetical protein